MRARILTIAGDVALRARLARLLKHAGYVVDLAESAEHARRIGLRGRALAIVASEGLGAEGKALIAELETNGVTTLILAGSGPESIDPSNEAGLLARIATLLQPTEEARAPEPTARFAGFRLDLAGHSLTDETGNDVALTRGEFSLLREFARRPGRVLSRDQLLQALAGRDAESYERSIDMLVVRLRRKIERDPKKPSLIVTVPGSGYKFTARVTTETAAASATVGLEPIPAAPQASSPATPERRQLTVLLCDLVGSTALSAQLDPEDLRGVIAAYHRCCANIIRRNGGTVAQLLGDGVLAYFGFPLASEHDAERAIRAGLSIIQSLRTLDAGHNASLHVRIGIATGLVVVGGDGDETDYALIATGETPNLAAKICKCATSDCILVAGSTRRLVGELFDCRPHEPITFDDTAEPIEVWQVMSEGAAGSRFEALHGVALTPLVGRDEELELLLRRWEQAKSGIGKLVLISGEPGIGKSRLTHAFQDAIVGQQHVEVRFFCSPYHQDSALHPFIAQLEHAASFTRDDTDEAKLTKLDAWLAHSDASDEAVALIAELLSIQTDQRQRIQQMTPQLRRDKTLAALLAQLTGLAAREPVLVIYEDLQWIDPSSRELLDRTIERLECLPVLLLATFRAEFQPPWVGQPNVTPVTLNRLDRQGTAAMIAEIIARSDLPSDIAQEIADRTDGVPLFIEELTKAALESGARVTETVVAVLHPELSVPATLYASLIARLDRLGPAARDIAQRGAAIGRQFHYQLIAAIVDRSEAQLQETLDRLTGAGLLFARGTPPQSVYLFKHALVQDTAYGTLVRAARQQVHARIAIALESQSPELATSQPELLAQHLTLAKQFLKAIPLWHRAGSLALKRMALAEAISQVRSGLDLLAAIPPSTDRDSMELDLRTLLGTAWITLKGWSAQEVWDSLYPALALANSLRRSDALVPTLSGIWNNVLCNGRVAESLSWFPPMLDAAQTYSDSALLILGHVAAMISYFFVGNLIKARQHSEQLLAIYTEERHGRVIDVLSSDPKTVGLAFTSFLTWLFGYPVQAAQISDAKDEQARRIGHPFNLGWALTYGAATFDFLREPDELLRRAEEAGRVGRENGLPFITEWLVPSFRGFALIHKRQLAEGTAWLKTALAIAPPPASIGLPHLKSVLAEGIAELGDVDSALELIADVMAQVERPGWEERWHYAETLRIKGWLLSLKGDLEDAERNYIASLDWARHQQAKSWELRTATSYARLLGDQGRVREAYELLAPIYGWFAEGFETKDLVEARALLDELEGMQTGSPAAPMSRSFES